MSNIWPCLVGIDEQIWKAGRRYRLKFSQIWDAENRASVSGDTEARTDALADFDCRQNRAMIGGPHVVAVSRVDHLRLQDTDICRPFGQEDVIDPSILRRAIG